MIGITTQTLADRYLVGRTIARVEVVRMEDPQGRTSTHLAEVVFTDGTLSPLRGSSHDSHRHALRGD